MRKLILLAATGAGVGYSPVAPGTAGSLVGVALWAALVHARPALFALVLAALAAGAVAIAGRAEGLLGRDDPRIVIDEVAGMLLSLAALPARADVALAGFLLFRLFDIWKPPPLRSAEALPGGLGVVLDDLGAGLYANLVGQVLWRVLWPGGLL